MQTRGHLILDAPGPCLSTHIANTTWGRQQPPFLGWFPIHSLASVRSSNESGLASHFGHSWPCWGPGPGDIPARQVGEKGPRWGRFAWRNEEQEDSQQAQGAEPLEGQRRDALQGIVAEDPAGRRGRVGGNVGGIIKGYHFRW